MATEHNSALEKYMHPDILRTWVKRNGTPENVALVDAAFREVRNAVLDEIERRIDSEEVQTGIGDEGSGDFAFSALNADDVQRIIEDMRRA